MNKRKTGFILILICSMALGLLYPQNQGKKLGRSDFTGGLSQA
jgi:hypothetical protein